MSASDAFTTDLSGLIEAIYGTVMEPALWPGVLRRIAEAVNGTQTLLFLSSPDGSGRALRCNHTPDEVLFPFLEHYSAINVLSAPCDRMFRDGSARFSHLALPDVVFERSEFYQDFFRKQDLHYSLGVKDHSPAGELTYLSVQRPWKLSPFSETDGQVLVWLMPHIKQALSLEGHLQTQQLQRSTAEEVLRAFGRVVIGISEKGEVRYANAAAEDLLRRGRVLYQAGRRLYARDGRSNEVLQAKLRAVLGLGASFAQQPFQAVLIHDPEAGRAMQVVIKPQRTDWPSCGMTFRAVVCISWSGEAYTSRGALLGELYQLSATECRVADLLLAGQELKEIAERLSLTLATTRFYVKRILNKTGARRQSELTRLMLDLPSFSSGNG